MGRSPLLVPTVSLSPADETGGDRPRPSRCGGPPQKREPDNPFRATAGQGH